MKRSLQIAVVLVSMFGLVSTASAGSKQGSNKNNSSQSNKKPAAKPTTRPLVKPQSNQSKPQKVTKPAQGVSGSKKPEPWKISGDVFGQPNGKPMTQPFDKRVPHLAQPVGPNRGDGRVPVAPQATPSMTIRQSNVQSLPSQPASRPGYVFVNGHWERAKAGSPMNPTSPNPIIRDHRLPQNRVRDNVTVTDPSAPPRQPKAITSEGPGLHNLFGLTDPAFSVPQTPNPKYSNFGGFARDHRDSQGGGKKGR